MTDTPTPISATDIGERRFGTDHDRALIAAMHRIRADEHPVEVAEDYFAPPTPTFNMIEQFADFGLRALTVIEAQERTIADLKQGLDQIIGERDGAEEWADCLAYAIAPVEIIGEHSSMNNPWSAAIEALAGQRQVTERTIADLTARVREFERANYGLAPMTGPPPMPSIAVRRNDRGAWCVYVNGHFVSDHRTHDAARIAARQHEWFDINRPKPEARP